MDGWKGVGVGNRMSCRKCIIVVSFMIDSRSNDNEIQNGRFIHSGR